MALQEVGFPLSDSSLHLLTCYFNKDLFSSATPLQSSPYLPAENADFISEVEAGQEVERESCGRSQGFQGVEAPWEM